MATVPQKYVVEYGLETKANRRVEIDLSTNRAIFDNYLETRHPDTLTALDELWNVASKFEIDSNAVAAHPERYPWFNPDTAHQSIKYLRQAVQMSTVAIPHYAKSAFTTRLTDDLTAPYTRTLQDLLYTYQTAHAPYPDAELALIELKKVLKEQLKPVWKNYRDIHNKLDQPDQRDWTESLLNVQLFHNLKELACTAAVVLHEAAAAIDHHSAETIAQTVYAPLHDRIELNATKTTSPLTAYMLLHPDTPADQITRRVHDLTKRNMQAEVRSQRAEVSARQENFAQQLRHQTRLATADIMHELLEVLQTHQTYPANPCPSNNDWSHLAAALNTATQSCSEEQKLEAATTVANVINHPGTRWRQNPDQPTVPQPYANIDDTMAQLHWEAVQVLRSDALDQHREQTNLLAGAIASGNQELASQCTQKAKLIRRQADTCGANRHIPFDFSDPENKRQYESLNLQVTARIIELLDKLADQLKHGPTFRNLLKDPAYNRTLERFLKQYLEEDRYVVLEQMLNNS